LVAEGDERQSAWGLIPEVLSMLDGGSEDTNGREPGIGIGYILSSGGLAIRVNRLLHRARKC